MMKLETIPDLIAKVRKSREGVHDVLLRNPADFKLEHAGGNDGYRFQLAGKVYPVKASGMASICRLLKMPQEYFERFPRPEAFADHVHTLLPRMHSGGVLLRLNGELRGVLPRNYKVFDDDQALELIGDLAQRHLPAIKGVAVTSHGWDRSCYRILFGDSALKQDEIYPVVNFANSEIGFTPLTMDAGTFRLVCLNGSMRPLMRGQRFYWNHFGDFQTRIDAVTAFLRRQAQVAMETSEAIQRAVNKVIVSPIDEIWRLNSAHWISRSFAKDVQKRLEPTDKVTKYDIFNHLTNASQALALPDRMRTEAVAHAYLLAKN
jgi:hypothetical protein